MYSSVSEGAAAPGFVGRVGSSEVAPIGPLGGGTNEGWACADDGAHFGGLGFFRRRTGAVYSSSESELNSLSGSRAKTTPIGSEAEPSSSSKDVV